MGRRKQQKPKRTSSDASADPKSPAEPNIGPDADDDDDDDGRARLKKFRLEDFSEKKWFESHKAAAVASTPFDINRFNAELAWLHWQQQQQQQQQQHQQQQQQRMKYSSNDLTQKDSPLDLSSTVRGPESTFHAWQMLLKERDARLMTPSMASTTSPPWAFLRSFAALTEKIPQPGFEPSQATSIAESQRALSALQQISQLTSQLSQPGVRLPIPTSSGPMSPFLQRPQLALSVPGTWPPILAHQLPTPPGGQLTSSPQSKFEFSRHQVFKCVVCNDNFASLDGLTRHLKESDHGNADQRQIMSDNNSPDSVVTKNDSRTTFSRSSTPPMSPKSTPPKQLASSSSSTSLPRKLVRGQDVWLGKGQEQTRQILKCMWCGQSFPSLADLTVHMQETRHYTKVISQEQIAAWNCGSSATSPTPTSTQAEAKVASSSKRDAAKNQINSIFTCKVCHSSFPSLRDLSVHIALKNHQNDPAPEAAIAALPVSKAKAAKRSPQQFGGGSGERKKKSLPVRKLLELERASQVCQLDADEMNQDDDVIKCVMVGDDENANIDVVQSGECSISILGSLEKLVESSFTEMKNVGKKKNGNGILQRLGIDDEHPPLFHTSTRSSDAKMTSSNVVFDFYRTGKIFKRFCKNEVNMSNVDKEDVDSESDVESATPNSVTGNSNPLLALKELCNNTTTTTTTSSAASQKRQKTLRSDESSLSSASSTPKMLIENRQNDVENNVASLKRVIESECQTPENGLDEKMERNSKIRVKNDAELFKTSRNRRSRRHGATTLIGTQNDDKKVPDETSMQSNTTEAKFFRYSELAKVLSAGN